MWIYWVDKVRYNARRALMPQFVLLCRSIELINGAVSQSGRRNIDGSPRVVQKGEEAKYIITSQKPLSIHKFWPIYSKIAPDGYRISPIGDGIGKF
jgi:hypothetical protein